MLFIISYTQGIDSYYIKGASLTHGGAGRHKHIWTFAAGVTEVSTSFPTSGCPCDTGTMVMSLHLLEMISSARVAYTRPGVIGTYSILMMSSGMVRTVYPLAHAVSSTTVVYKEPDQYNIMQQLMTLN